MKRERKNNLFTSVPSANVPRNLFDLSHEVKMSGKFGYLYPVLLMDCMPGDTIGNELSIMARFAPMLAPVMHRVDVTYHAFFVPMRLLTELWEDFITGGQDGTLTPVLPYITPDGIGSTAARPELMNVGSLWDYLGLPPVQDVPGAWSEEQISVLPFRACAKVWNDYYRDPNFDEEMDLDLELMGDVSASLSTHAMMEKSRYRRMWEKDYFTSALPWAQRGAQVLIPMAGEADVEYSSFSQVFTSQGGVPGDAFLGTTVGQGGRLKTQKVNVGDAGTDARIENIASVEFENGTVTINDFRRALAIQRWLENNARGGARYIEQIEGHFNVRVPDYRLQRAEYLGGGKQPVQISEVLATAESENVPVGDMAGHGLSVGRSNRWHYRCQEHGLIVGFLSVRMRTAYSQGIEPLWSKNNKFQFPWPELANLGEQEIKSKEIFFSFDAGDDTLNQSVFGYIPRYAEYKFKNDRIAGDFRTTLGFWHLGRNFTTRPVLDGEFTTLYENGETGEETYRRIFANQDGTDYLWFQLYHRLTAKRPLPYFGVPQII